MAEKIKHTPQPELIRGSLNLLNSSGFPTLHIGCRKLVTMDNLLVWMGNHTNSMTV